ncbi:MAG: protein phosphatase CheZ [Hydrogenophilales bacterium CG03_land_8_20_14_0_80_62_28]|nr:protein phosphatase CheZ [Betaproteobacteria bacterium]OIO79309.1 MAG: protein phosphatase CheZ [Hydrogenophilaceae bacterium CG1_02_62_390]PIV24557.1 MAG: protein phosphatase CheZ [Hydrogenophilales bacterium CG03_land_8_20_14_0_80_62_28]PIW39029.1 MAG: protein phosphatase CheZ [Hydrogenophilales bacterium CG15_BIG_FIL_POST_REV_8_21_14_020_62_31]PIW70768.1 MAG: protein phosphatase CheZ [Hydrogenophilales bacterium CG12_big_fil_rev_8_21_14_0_65_61_21]PIY99545.1 MAG: protein phosphatase CheZ
MSSDSPELEALFDSIAFSTEAKHEPEQVSKIEGDSPELEMLFDSITQGMAAGASGDANAKVFAQIGQMTRSLHNLLRELGLDRSLENFAAELPDTRDRLNYIGVLTTQAAENTLNAAEAAQPIQAEIGRSAKALAGEWDRLFAKQLGVDEFKILVADTHAFLRNTPGQAEAINSQLMEIIMAQGFQDLTGQVIKKVLDAAQNMEKQLVALLLETTPGNKRDAVRPNLLEGPIIDAAGRVDVVASQEQVDELLDSLGF